MEQVGVRDLKQNASQVLRRVKGGESLEVTERGRPVARLTPVRDDPDRELLVDRGELSMGDQDLLKGNPIRMVSRARLSEELESLRDDWR